MKEIIDNFSNHAQSYKKFRPTYPIKLYDLILSFCKNKSQCWDCGTGNGQVAVELSKYFDKVYATDISENQLIHAEKNSNIFYSKQRAENTNFPNNKFDLITVAQAIHWFDLKTFYEEVSRVAKNNGIIAIWGYGLIKIEEKIDSIIDKFYTEIIGPYWDKEREHIDNHYNSIGFNFRQLHLTDNLSIKVNWKIEELIGYLNTWSSVQKYKSINPNTNPIDEIIPQIHKLWNRDQMKEVQFPIFTKIGVIEK